MAEVKREFGKKTVSIAVIGAIGTGKTTIIQRIRKALLAEGFEVEVEWGTEGAPVLSEEKYLPVVIKKSKIVMSEFQTRKTMGKAPSHLNPEETSVQTLYYPDQGHIVQVTAMGVPLRHCTGNLPLSRERAKIIAARLAASLDIEVEDLVSREDHLRFSET